MITNSRHQGGSNRPSLTLQKLCCLILSREQYLLINKFKYFQVAMDKIKGVRESATISSGLPGTASNVNLYF